MIYRNYIKRILDVLIAIIALVLLSPIILITCLLLAVLNKGKVFFTQERPGKNLQKIYILKFRSMTDERDAAGILLPDNVRTTAFGKFIRKASIDELPQLINVLKGDMSLIGPRPLLFKYVPLYSTEQNRRHEVRPGITGWAQVNGRNSISWKEKFEHDVYYVEHISFKLDIQIIFKTLQKVLIREGVNQSDNRPMLPFNGNN
ncbi:MAG: sugar transferase [Ferruginibacter sp.]